MQCGLSNPFLHALFLLDLGMWCIIRVVSKFYILKFNLLNFYTEFYKF